MSDALNVLWLLPVLGCIAWSIYNYSKLFKQKEELFLQKRSLFLVFGYTTSLLISMINILFTMTANIWLASEARFAGYGLSMIAIYLYLYFLNVKTWMIYYQYQWTKDALQFKWQMIINTNAILEAENDKTKEKEISWFVRNRNRYGNLQFVYKTFGIIHLLFAIICGVSATVFLPKNVMVGVSVLAIITICVVSFYCIIIWKTPPFNDIYYIHAENKLIAPVLIIGLIIYVAFWGIEAFLWYKDEEKNQDVIKIISNVAQIYLLLLWTVLLYISTTLIINKNVERKDRNIKNVTSSNTNLGLQKNIISNKLEKFDLESVLTNEETIDQFMKYLSREFSMELLLSYIEFSHFQQSLKQDKYKMDISLKENKEYKLLTFPKNVPQSSIVANQWALSICDPLQDPKTKAYKLYNKYVKTGAEFEINVSYATRKKCQNMLENFSLLLEDENIQIEDLFKIFHECKKQVTGLLNNSLTRFKNTTDHVHAPTNAQISVHVRDLSTQKIQTGITM